MTTKHVSNYLSLNAGTNIICNNPPTFRNTRGIVEIIIIQSSPADAMLRT